MVLVYVMVGTGCRTGASDSTGDDSAPPTTTVEVSCDTPVEILDSDGNSTGYVQCEDGAINRVEAVECDATVDTCRGEPDCPEDEYCTTIESPAGFTCQPSGSATD